MWRGVFKKKTLQDLNKDQNTSKVKGCLLFANFKIDCLKQDLIFVSLNIMARKSTDISRSATSDGFAYLTKRIVVSKAKSAGKAAAKNAMNLMGYVVTVKDGWVIKEHQDGKVEQIEKLQTA